MQRSYMTSHTQHFLQELKMKRFETTTHSPAGTMSFDAGTPVNAIDENGVYGQTSAPGAEIGRPRILARRMVRLGRRANR